MKPLPFNLHGLLVLQAVSPESIFYKDRRLLESELCRIVSRRCLACRGGYAASLQMLTGPYAGKVLHMIGVSLADYDPSTPAPRKPPNAGKPEAQGTAQTNL